VTLAAPNHAIEGVPVHWDNRRELFSLDPAVAHLNHGGFGAVPIPVQRAHQRLRDEMDANPTAFYSRGLLDRLAHTRRHLAAFVGADPDGVALVPNATAAAMAVLGSVRLAAGEEILVTDHGYGSILMSAEYVAGRAGATVRDVAVPLTADEDEILNRLVDAVRPRRTRLVIVDHVASPTAKLFPVARLARELGDRDVLVLVDAAHGPGMLPVDVTETGADFWLGNLHKWAYTPRPTALLSVAERHRASMRPLVVSWEQQHGFPRAQEFAGTLDYTAWLAAPAGVHLMRSLGAERIRAHNADLIAEGQRMIASTVAELWPGARAAAPAQPLLELARQGVLGDPALSLRVVPLPPGVATDRATAVELRTRIAVDHGVEVALDAWHGQGFLRLSAQIYNRLEDYDRLCRALPAVRPAA
jgi:isopenicillin-N epimerase